MTFKYLSREKIKEALKDPVLFSSEILDMPCVSETEEKILRSKSKRIILAAGRRWGKTTMLSIFSIWFALTKSNGKGSVICFAPSWDAADIFMDTTREILYSIHPKVFKLIKVSENKRRKIIINGCEILAKSATRTSRSVRGHGRKVILMIRDEDAFIPDDMMKAIRPIRLSNSAKEIVASTTAGHNHFYKDFNSDVYESFRVTTYDNKYLDAKEIDAEKELLTKSEFEQEYMAEFIDDRYSVFPQSLIDYATDFNRKMVEVPDENREYVMGIDLGRRRDATVIAIGHSENNHILIDLVKEISYLQDGRYWTNVLKEIENLISLFKIKNVHIDQTGIGDKPTEDLTNNLLDKNIMCNVKGIDFTRRNKNSKDGLVNALLLKFERREIHFPFCEKLIRELKNIRFEASDSPSSSMRTYGIYKSTGHDDYVAALLLCVNAMPMNQEIFYARTSSVPVLENLENSFDMPQLIVTNQQEL